MSCTLTIVDALEVLRPEISEFQRLAEKFADGSSEEACRAFSHQVTLGEGMIKTAYAFTAKAVRQSDDAGHVAACWSEFMELCDDLLRLLAELKQRFPQCGTHALYDQALDYRSAAQKRQANAQEEVECLKNEIPKGLLPSMN